VAVSALLACKDDGEAIAEFYPPRPRSGTAALVVGGFVSRLDVGNKIFTRAMLEAPLSVVGREGLQKRL